MHVVANDKFKITHNILNEFSPMNFQAPVISSTHENSPTTPCNENTRL